MRSVVLQQLFPSTYFYAHLGILHKIKHSVENAKMCINSKSAHKKMYMVH